jgi:hypothetical protein
LYPGGAWSQREQSQGHPSDQVTGKADDQLGGTFGIKYAEFEAGTAACARL